MTETKATNDFIVELKRKDSSGNVIETTTIYPGGYEETVEGEAQ